MSRPLYRVAFVMAFLAGCASSRSGDRPCSGASCDGGAGFDLSASLDDAAMRDSGPSPDLTPLKMFGDPCTDRTQCQSGICVFSGIGGVCTTICPQIGCPSGYGCYGVLGGGIDPGQVVQLCVPESNQLCTPCSKATECGSPLGTDQCLSYPTGSFCGRDCSKISCPPTYSCKSLTEGDGGTVQQCVPNNNSCDCTPGSMGRVISCSITTPTGTKCTGSSTCNGAQGWGSCAPPSATDLPDDSFTDSNCDGIDGDVAHALFVDTLTGNDNSPGTMAKPLVSITKAIALAAASGGAKTQILVSKGNYPPLVLNGSSGSPHIYGGYDAANNWQRASTNVVTISGGNPSVDISGVSSETRLDLITVSSNSASGGAGRSSYGVRVLGSAGPIQLHWCNITAGDATGGTNGGPGAKGANGGSGTNGGNGCECSGTSAGGPGGSSSCNAGGAGGTGVGGSGNAYPGSSGAGASGGSAGSYGCGCSKGVSCSCGARCAPTGGGTGGSGAAGASGGAAAAIGSTNATDYVPAGGASGVNGTDGSGGGGGGGGGGSDDPYYCNEYVGGGGGGGGGAGCHGNGGGAGTGGGGSFGLFSLGSIVAVDRCTLTSGAGGNGGSGNAGGLGGSYGAAGFGGQPSTDGQQGGNGGPGGAGGAGGNGSGGSGGPSVGIFAVGGTLTQPGSSNSFQPGTGGSGGAGGSNGVASAAPAGQSGTSTGVIVK